MKKASIYVLVLLFIVAFTTANAIKTVSSYSELA